MDKMTQQGDGSRMRQEIDFIQRERDRKIVTIVYSFLHAFRTFRQIENDYKEGSLRFNELAKFVDDRGQSFLFTLKTTCHDLFRQSSSYTTQNEQIFDLTIGSIFHLAMKLREDIYQLEFYGPKYTELNEKGNAHQGQEALILKFKETLSRAITSLQEGMEEVATLMEDSFRQFKDLLREYRENGLLLRFILEERQLLEGVFGENGPGEVFRFLYPRDESEPYRLAGESYFDSAFYSRAIHAFSQALEKCPGDESLQFKIFLGQGMEHFYAFNLGEALQSFEQCLSVSAKVEILESHRSLIRKVCQKIQEEFPGRRKDDQHRDLVKKANALQKKLQELPPAASDLHPA
jgi:tetratricopeptide (TPR) repeat protein